MQLLGDAFLVEHDVLRVVLPPHLLPGGQGRVSVDEWSLSPSEHLEPAALCRRLGSYG